MKSAFWCRHIFIAALVLLSPGVSNAMTVEQRPKEMTVLNPKFVEGFHHELANRAFSRLATARMVKTVDDQDALVFWSAYHQLEIFNLPIYQHVLEEWGIDNSVGW